MTAASSFQTQTISGTQTIAGIPISGRRVPALDAFDRTIAEFMQQRNLKALTLAISRGDRVIFSRGYGYGDPQLRTVVSPNALMRVASVDKPVTNAAIEQLVRQGRLSHTTKVFPLLGITSVADPRFNDITVKHLQDHKWWEGVHHYPHHNLVDVARLLGVSSPPSTLDIARYIARRPLQYAPGTRGDYCGFCYDLLREVVEKISGKSIVEYLRTDLGMFDVAQAQAIPQKRHPQEIWYISPGYCRNLYSPRSRDPVPCADGGFPVWRTTFITSSPALADFLNRYWISGHPRPSGSTGAVYAFFGGWPGTYAMVSQRPDGINMAVLSNGGDGYDNLKDILDRVADRIQQWP